jgi:hypothetical protein
MVIGGPSAVEDGRDVQQWECLGASQTNQLWDLVPVGDYFQIVAAHSGKCLEVTAAADINGAVVQQSECLGPTQRNQLWNLVSIP